MNKFTKVSFCMVSVLVILVSMCPISAFANQPSSYYPLSIQQPVVTDHSGYIEYLSTNLNYGYQTVDVLYWSFTPSVSGNTSSYVSDMLNISLSRDSDSISLTFTCDPGVTGFLSLALCPYNGDIVYYDYFITTTATTIETPARSGYELASVHYYGNYIDAGNLNDYNNQEFFVTYSADSVVNFQLTNIFSVLNSILQYMETTEPSEDWEYDYYSDLSSILLALNNLDATSSTFRQDYLREVGKLLDLTEDVLSKIDITNVWLEEIFLFLETWVIQIHNLLDELYYVEVDSYIKLDEIKSTLDSILAILQSKGESDFSEPDTSNLNGYYDTEHSLLDDSNVDTSQIFNVDLNENALTAIWDLVDKVLNVNPKVFGAVITILALGLIALILGR